MYLLPSFRSTTLPTIMVCPTIDNNKFWTSFPRYEIFENLQPSIMNEGGVKLRLLKLFTFVRN